MADPRRDGVMRGYEHYQPVTLPQVYRADPEVQALFGDPGYVHSPSRLTRTGYEGLFPWLGRMAHEAVVPPVQQVRERSLNPAQRDADFARFMNDVHTPDERQGSYKGFEPQPYADKGGAKRGPLLEALAGAAKGPGLPPAIPPTSLLGGYGQPSLPPAQPLPPVRQTFVNGPSISYRQY